MEGIVDKIATQNKSPFPLEIFSLAGDYQLQHQRQSQSTVKYLRWRF